MLINVMVFMDDENIENLEKNNNNKKHADLCK